MLNLRQWGNGEETGYTGEIIVTEPSNKIACTHPGKMGDCLYVLPAVKALCELQGTTADFYSSTYCAPLKELFEYQSYIDNFYIAPNYRVERMDMGCQPWYVPVDRSLYSKVYHMGFRRVPDQALPDFIGYEVGVKVGPVEYQVPENPYHGQSYFTLSTRGHTSYEATFQEFVDKSPIEVLIVGGEGDYLGFGTPAMGLNFLETAAILSGSKGFVGLMSSQLVLANGFPIPKVIPHDGIHWDMRHVVRSENHFYMVNPSADEILEVFDAVLQNP